MATEKRLIDAHDWDSFYADMADSRNMMDCYDRGYTDALDRVDDWMDAQPTVDASPVVHGRWIFKHDPIADPKKYFIRIVCSVCNLHTGQKSNYCPQCGAKMDLEVTHHG